MTTTRLSPRAQLAAAVRSVNARLAQLPSSKWPDLPGPRWVELMAKVDDLEAKGETDKALDLARRWEREAIERIDQVLSEMARDLEGGDPLRASWGPVRSAPDPTRIQLKWFPRGSR